MAAPLPPTLGKLRNSVAIRAGLATNGTLTTTVRGYIDEAINSCQRKIYLRAAWARQLMTEEIALTQGVRDYDLPAAVNYIGDVMQLLLQNDVGVRTALVYDDSWIHTSNDAIVNTPGRPSRWAYIDDVIRLDRIVDATTYPTMVAEVMKSDQALVQEGDHACVDGEALVMCATIEVKRLLGIDFDLDGERGEYVQYMNDLRSNRVGPGRSFSIASERDTGVPYRQGYGYPQFWPDWNPNGGAGW